MIERFVIAVMAHDLSQPEKKHWRGSGQTFRGTSVCTATLNQARAAFVAPSEHLQVLAYTVTVNNSEQFANFESLGPPSDLAFPVSVGEVHSEIAAVKKTLETVRKIAPKATGILFVQADAIYSSNLLRSLCEAHARSGKTWTSATCGPNAEIGVRAFRIGDLMTRLRELELACVNHTDWSSVLRSGQEFLTSFSGTFCNFGPLDWISARTPSEYENQIARFEAQVGLTDSRKEASATKWVGFDLDGTLAMPSSDRSPGLVGEPVSRMVSYLRFLVSRGINCKIFTARAANPDAAESAYEIFCVREWCIKHLGLSLEITATKDAGCLAVIDDRAAGVGLSADPMSPSISFGYGVREDLQTMWTQA